MARPSTAAALLLLALSLLAAAHGRPIEAEAAGSNAVVVAVTDENGAAENPTTLPADAGASATKLTVVQPAEEQAEQHGGFLRLPSQRHRRPCRHGLRHRRHGWVRHQIFSGDADAPRWFRSRHGEERLAAVLPAEEEVKAVAEPVPDRSLPDSDGSEGELASTVVPSFADADGARDADDQGAAAVRAWKKEMLRRWVHFHSQSHHGMRHHRLHHGEHAAEDEAAVAGEGEKRFHHRRHHGDEEEEDEEKEKTMRKRFRPAAEQQHDDDSDDDEEVEEMVRRFRKAVMRRTRFGHGRRFHHHHGHHRHGEEAEKQAEGGEESGVVMTWIKGLMNRF